MRYLKQISTGEILTTISDPKPRKVPIPNPKEGDFYYDNGTNTENKKSGYRKFIGGEWMDTRSLMMKQDYIERGIASDDLEEGINTPTIIEQMINDSISLVDYKSRKKDEQLQIGLNTFKIFMHDFRNTDIVISTKRLSMKNYFVNTIEKNINKAVNKTSVDNVIKSINWKSI